MVYILSSIFRNFTAKNKIEFLLLIINIIFLSLIKVPLPYFSKIIIDNILNSKQYNLILPIITIFIIIIFIQIVFGKLNAYQTANFFQNFIFTIRKKIFNKSIHDYNTNNEKIGFVQTLIISDIENLSNNYMTIISTFFSSIILVVGYIIIMCILSLRLSIICLAFVPLYIIWTIYMSEKLKKYSLVAQNEKGELISTLIHFLTSLIPIHLYSYFYKVEEEFNYVNDRNRKINKKIINMQSFFMIISNTIVVLASFLPFFIGIYYVINNRITVGELIAFNGYATSMFSPLTALINLYLLTKSSEVYEQRINSIISSSKKEKFYNSNLENKNMETKDLLVINNYSLYTDNNMVLINDSSLTIGKQEIIKIDGDNGVGKSLFLKSIVGLYKNFSGSIIFKNTSISEISISDISNNILYVDSSQKFVLKDFFKELELLNPESKNIDFIYNLIDYKYDESTNTNFEIFKRENLNYNLSTGQTQLLRIARALFKNPEILILDEILSNIEKKKVDILLKNIIKYYPDISIIIVDHHMAETKYLTRIINIKEKSIYSY